MFVPIRIISGNIFHSFYSRLTPRKTTLSECWYGYKKKFVFTIRFDINKKTRKRKPWRTKKQWTLSFIEEAWICRTGAICQRFSVKRRQAGSDREVRVTLERRSGKEKHLCPAEQAQFIAFFRQTEASRKRARRLSHARKEEYKKRKVKPAVPCTYANYSS